jgi:hypothetical protein
MAGTSPREIKESTEYNPFETVKRQVDKCAEILELDPQITALLKTPLRELRVSLPVRMDDGKVKIFQGLMMPGDPPKVVSVSIRRRLSTLFVLFQPG